MAKIKKKEWTLLALAAANGKSLSPVQLQKILFLFGQKMPKAVAGNYYQFVPYNYGPFDSSIYSDADMLIGQSLAVLQQRPGCRWSEFAATPDGMKRAREIMKDVPKEELEYLAAVVKWVCTLSFRDLLRAVYAKYPDYATNSVFRG